MKTHTCPKCQTALHEDWTSQVFTVNELRGWMNLRPSARRDADTATVTRDVCMVQCACGFTDFRVKLVMEAQS